MTTWARMRERAAEGHETAVGIIGAGFMGRGLVRQLHLSPGMRPAVVVNRTVETAARAYEDAGVDTDPVITDDVDVAAGAIAEGRPLVTADPELLAALEAVDLVVEATGALAYGALAMLRVLASGKDVVSLNAEVDATIGHLLHEEAQRAGSVYSIADGDQPGVLLRQLEFVEAMGFEAVAALNCKRNLDRHQTPDDSRPFAERDGTSVAMTTAFGDGTKMQIESAVVANRTGLVPERRGMHGVRTTLAEAVDDVVSTIAGSGVVDYTLGGDFAGGVCVIGRSDDPGVSNYMRYAKMGAGPDHLFYRPFHLMHFEVPFTIAEVTLDRQPLGVLRRGPITEVVAVAKRDLAPGDRLDGIGGFTCYGEIDVADRAADFLAIGLSDGAHVVATVKRDEPVPLASVALDEENEVVRLRRLQDAATARR